MTINIPKRRLILIALLIIAIIATIIIFAVTDSSAGATPRTTRLSVPEWEATLAAAPEERSLGGDVVALTGKATCTGIAGNTATLSVQTTSGREYAFTFQIGQVPVYRSDEFLAQPAPNAPTVENPQAVLEGLQSTPVVVVFRQADPPQVGSILVMGGQR